MKIHYSKQRFWWCSGKLSSDYVKKVTCPNCLRAAIKYAPHWQTRLTARTNLSYHYPTAYRNWFGS